MYNQHNASLIMRQIQLTHNHCLSNLSLEREVQNLARHHCTVCVVKLAGCRTSVRTRSPLLVGVESTHCEVLGSVVTAGACACGCEGCDAMAVGDGSRFQCVNGFLASAVASRKRNASIERRMAFMVLSCQRTGRDCRSLIVVDSIGVPEL